MLRRAGPAAYASLASSSSKAGAASSKGPSARQQRREAKTAELMAHMREKDGREGPAEGKDTDLESGPGGMRPRVWLWPHVEGSLVGKAAGLVAYEVSRASTST